MLQLVAAEPHAAPPRRARRRRRVSPLRLLAGAAFWLPIATFTGLIIANTLPYYSFSGTDTFFLERPRAARNPAWQVCFYIHVAGGMLVLASALLQFSRTLQRRAVALHRNLGRVYVFAVLVMTAPTGLFLAFFAKGGAPGRIGFAVQGVVLFYATWIGLARILEGRVAAHRTWMTRSYAAAATAITFRLWYVGLWYLGATIDIYVAAIWLSSATNLVLCEAWLHVTSPHPKRVPA